MSARHVALFRALAQHAVMRAGTRASPAECPGAREQTRALASNCSSTVPRSAAPACARRGSATVMPPSCRVACVMTGLQNAKVLLGFSLDGMNNHTGTLIHHCSSCRAHRSPRSPYHSFAVLGHSTLRVRCPRACSYLRNGWELRESPDIVMTALARCA